MNFLQVCLLVVSFHVLSELELCKHEYWDPALKSAAEKSDLNLA